MKVVTESRLKALVRLLDEEERFAGIIQEHLLRAGVAALPYLKDACHSSNPVVRERAGYIAHRLRFERLKEEFRRYAALSDWEMDLEVGAFLVARYGYPDVEIAYCSRELDRIAHSIGALLKDEMYMDDVVEIINRTLFDQEGFRPDNRRFYDPENSYVNRVIERRTGIPITLSLIYLLIAERLQLPISGVAVPGHFLVRYDGPFETLWIDPFNEGAVLTRDDCEELLRAMGCPVTDEYLKPCTTRQIIARMLNNLAQVFTREGDPVKAGEVRSLAEIVMG